jgi:hypothetical protein
MILKNTNKSLHKIGTFFNIPTIIDINKFIKSAAASQDIDKENHQENYQCFFIPKKDFTIKLSIYFSENKNWNGFNFWLKKIYLQIINTSIKDKYIDPIALIIYKNSNFKANLGSYVIPENYLEISETNKNILLEKSFELRTNFFYKKHQNEKLLNIEKMFDDKQFHIISYIDFLIIVSYFYFFI